MLRYHNTNIIVIEIDYKFGLIYFVRLFGIVSIEFCFVLVLFLKSNRMCLSFAELFACVDFETRGLHRARWMRSKYL